MKNVKIIGIIFFIVSFFISCQEDELPKEVDLPAEKFERFDNYNFNGQASNVTSIKTIGDRLYYSHRTNPGYITDNMEVNQLCCSRNNQMEFRQALSRNYIVTVDRSLTGFNIYNVENRGHGSMAFISLSRLLEDLEGNKVVSTIGIGSQQNNFDINGTKMLANIQLDGKNIAYIFDIEENANFYGVINSKDVVKVEFPENTHRSNGDWIFVVNAFQDGWIASVSTGDGNSSPNFLISKDGSVQNFTLEEMPRGIYMGHEFTSDGRLFMNIERYIYISESGKVEDLKAHISMNVLFNMRIIEDRMVVWNNSGAAIYEIENFDSRDPDLFNIRKLNNGGIEHSGLNELEVFNGKVFAATSQGLFSKSLESFWDSLPEVDDVQDQSFREGVEFVMN